jgi:hypothetical protein
MCPESSHDAYQVISVRAQILSDAEEEYPVPLTFVGIKAEPEVSCVSVSMLGGLHKYKYPSFYRHSIYELLLHGTTYIRKK